MSSPVPIFPICFFKPKEIERRDVRTSINRLWKWLWGVKEVVQFKDWRSENTYMYMCVFPVSQHMQGLVMFAYFKTGWLCLMLSNCPSLTGFWPGATETGVANSTFIHILGCNIWSLETGWEPWDSMLAWRQNKLHFYSECYWQQLA